jgi:concentrative nucleoside transporter, CNT family
MLRLVSALGLLALLGLAWLTCPRERRAHVRWRGIGVAVGLLITLAALLLRTPFHRVFGFANGAVDTLLSFSDAGAAFVFGKLVTDREGFGFTFAFRVLPTLLFFSALMSVGYYCRVLPWLVERGGRVLSRLVGVSGAESLSTVADIFVGQTEAPLVIRPYLPRLTESELCACMVAGFATTAGGVLAAYVAMLSSSVPGIAGHLVASSVMAAPASLAISKLMLPETSIPETSGMKVTIPRAHSNLLEAISAGTSDGLKLAVNVAAMLIVFLAFTAALNAGFTWLGSLVGINLSLERLLGWAFSPLAFALGIAPAEAERVGTLLGQKTVFNEFVAYSTMSSNLAVDPNWLSPRARLITSYALCGFANFGSIGVQIGGYASLAPERRADVARLALRAMLGGLLATCSVAATVGIFE